MLLPAFCHEDKHKSPVSLHIIALVIIVLFMCSVTKATRACAVISLCYGSIIFGFSVRPFLPIYSVRYYLSVDYFLKYLFE